MKLPLNNRRLLAVAASCATLITGACDSASEIVAPATATETADAPAYSISARNPRGGSGTPGTPGTPGTSLGFTVLARTAVTCTNGTISGNVGTFTPPTAGSFTQTLCPVAGEVHIGDAAAVTAYNAFVAEYNALAPQPGDNCPIRTGTLGGENLPPGVYCVSAEEKTGVLTLTGPPDGVWTFKVAPGALTGTNFTMIMLGGAQACNVTWWVDAAATMTDSNPKGRILARAGVTLTRGTLNGNAWSQADVTVTGTAMTGCVVAQVPDDDDDDDDDDNDRCKDKDHKDRGDHSKKDDRERDERDKKDKKDRDDRDDRNDRDRDNDRNRDKNDRNDRDNDRNDNRNDKGRNDNDRGRN